MTMLQIALPIYRETIRSYIKDEGNGSIDIMVPVSIERLNKAKAIDT